MPGRAPRVPPTDHVRRNRQDWDAESDAYEHRHSKVLGGRQAMSWGLFRRPERELRALGEIRGRRILELGCGAARWAVALSRAGARPVGLDLSSAHLRHAQQVVRASRTRVPLVRGNAEALPFADDSFDIVFCDFGAMTFSDPYRTVPEAARLLRPGGRLVFTTHSALRVIATDPRPDRLRRRLRADYFGLHRQVFPHSVEFTLPYGEWIDLFGTNGLVVERLIESRAPAGGRSSYLSASDYEWARHFPIECLWQVRKPGSAHPNARAARRQKTRGTG